MSITDQILSDREQTHGLFREVASYSQAFKNMMRTSRNWQRLDVAQAQALEVVADKVARILCGDPSYQDHWQDGAGYFELVLRDLVQAQAPVTRATMPDRLSDEPLDARPRHKRTVWLNIYGSGIVPEACSAKERADFYAGCNRIACIKVELDFEEGEGL